MGGRLIAAVTTAAALLVCVGAAGAAERRVVVNHERTSVEGGIALYHAGSGASAAGVAVYAWRITSDRVYANDIVGARPSASDATLICVAYGSKAWQDSGCVVRPPAPVATGAVLPETVPIKVRVPSSTRKGEWLEADVLLQGQGAPRLPAVGGSYATALPDVASPYVNRWANLVVSVYREAQVTGTVRTSRTAAQRPSKAVLAGVLRGTVANNSVHARTDLAAVARDVLPALRELAAR